jgi:hypothetical protein
VRARNAALLQGIREGGALPEDELNGAVKAFKERFTPTAAVEA